MSRTWPDPEQQQAWEKVNPLFEGTPAARFYEVVGALDRVPVVGRLD